MIGKRITSGQLSLMSPTLSAITVGSASYTDQSVSAPTYTEVEIISENF